jgi:glycosyltransferase involved in cell wall biosynthesis
MARLPAALWRAWRRMRDNDLTYINTSIIADYALAARLKPRKALLHIHEIPEGVLRKVLVALMRWSRADLIFNSRATRATFGDPPPIDAKGRRTHVVYNGVAGPAAALPMTYDGSRPLKVLLLGRVNRIKGQEVLLDAVASLPAELRDRVEVRLVGGAFESVEREQALAELVGRIGLAGHVKVLPFVSDPADHYRWADIVAVPSRRPESLGRVAIEAMGWGRPPLVSAIGGLVEVVADGETGWHVPPGNAAALAGKLGEIILRPDRWRGFAAAGRARYEAVFSEPIAAAAIVAIVADKLKAATPRQARARVAREAETSP